MRFIFLAWLIIFPCTIAFSQPPSIDGCQIFPSDNPWNLDISTYPIHPKSDIFINAINKTKQYLHADFGSDSLYGIPYTLVDSTQPWVQITYSQYGDESDPGPFPVPANALVEGGWNASSNSDRHVLVIDKSNCMLYEFWQAFKDQTGTGWTMANGAKFDLSKTVYRPDGWTSADAAGLPIFPGLVRYEEVAAGAINHAVRFTSDNSQRGWITPARHQAGKSDTTFPPMGLRLRMKANYDISNVTGQSKIIMQALKKYGMILADNGSSWFISGTSNPLWDDNDLNQLKKIPGSAFEAVYTGPIKTSPEQSVKSTTDNSLLLQNIPNPVTDKTEISFTLPTSGYISLKVYNLGGVEIANLISGEFEAGDHSVTYDARLLANGVYFYRLNTPKQSLVKEMVVVK